MKESRSITFPERLHIVTYDVCGTKIATGVEKKTRKTGIVTFTHQLIDGFFQEAPSMDLVVTQTGSPEESSYELLTPEEKVIRVQSIHAYFPELEDPETKQVSPERITYFYETDIRNPNNPVYRSLAEQYADAIQQSNTSDLLLQNPNPLVSILKAEEFNCLNPERSQQLNITVVLHDINGYQHRFAYIKDRMQETKVNLKFIAISQTVYEYLRQVGIPESSITIVPNGLNIERFDQSVQTAKEQQIFSRVQERNNLPKSKKLIFDPTPRVRLKGQFDVIDAADILNNEGELDDSYIAFAGKNMVDAKALTYEEELLERIRRKALSDKIFLLDSLTPAELASCYGEAYLSVTPSTKPEGFSYCNIESMLAGAPIITTPLGGPSEYIVHGKTGLFVHPNNPPDLAQAIKKVLNSPEDHDSLVVNGRLKAEEYSLERMINGYLQTIMKIR